MAPTDTESTEDRKQRLDAQARIIRLLYPLLPSIDSRTTWFDGDTHAPERQTTLRRFKYQSSLQLTGHAASGDASRVGGEQYEELQVNSPLFELWLERKGESVALIVEAKKAQGNAIANVLVTDEQGENVFSCSADDLDEFGVARLELGSLRPGVSMTRDVRVESPLGVETIPLELLWK